MLLADKTVFKKRGNTIFVALSVSFKRCGLFLKQNKYQPNLIILNIIYVIECYLEMNLFHTQFIYYYITLFTFMYYYYIKSVTIVLKLALFFSWMGGLIQLKKTKSLFSAEC